MGYWFYWKKVLHSDVKIDEERASEWEWFTLVLVDSPMFEEVAIGVEWVMFVKDVIEVVRVEEPDKLSSSEVEPWLA